MSLILDALRKLDRDKDKGEPGVVVVGPVPWAGASRPRSPLLVLGAALVVALALGGAWLLRSRPSHPSPAAGPRPAAPAPTPAPTALEPALRGAEAQAPPARPVDLPARVTTPPSPDAGVTGPATPRPQTAPASPPPLHLNAISQRDGRPIALINDRLVREGDSFDGVRILRIGEAEVEVEVDGKRQVLRF